ncbi:hypothetical protein NKG99_03810 [Mesorhizobium sp. M1409]|uniref:hypothetical protein n=1 Tax=Mesorhizobium sp. M1409 TaxID=2957100 RepID=UPI003338FFCD
MARLQPGSLTFAIAAQATIEATQKMVVAVAKREHAAVMNTAPMPSSFIRIVDGQQGTPEEAVKPFGVIVYTYPRLEEVVRFAMQTLFDLSPVLSGEYRNSHTLFVNGAAAANLDGYIPGADLAITNYVPYSRKIEVGSMKMRVPGTEEVYQQARRVIMARFGNIAKVQFTYRGIVGGSQVNQALAASSGQPWWMGDGAARPASGLLESATGKKHGKTAHNKPGARFPALIITER